MKKTRIVSLKKIYKGRIDRLVSGRLRKFSKKDFIIELRSVTGWLAVEL